MALGTLIRALCLAALFAGGLSAAHAETYQAELTLRGSTYALAETNGHCTLSNGVGVLTLNIPAPCGFVRLKDDPEPQSFTYGAVRSVVFVAGPIVSDEDPSLCAASGQSVIIDGTDLTLGRARLIADFYCHARGLDEIVFRTVSDQGF